MSENNNNGFMSMFQGGAFPMPSMASMASMPSMPPMPFAPFQNAWGWGGNKEGDNTQMNQFKSMIKDYWTQNIDMQKTSAENGKEQWNQFFERMMEMQVTFAASMPDDTSSMPFAQMLPMTPKAFMGWVRDFEEMVNQHFVEQADSFADFCIQGQQKVCDMVSSSMESTDAENN